MKSRRTFIKASATLGTAAIVAPSAIAAIRISAPSPLLCFFTKHLQWLGFDDTATVLSSAGFDGADLTVRRGGHIEPMEAARELPRALKAFEKQGLKVPMVVSHIRSASDKNLDEFLRVLSANGVKYYRMGYLSYDHALSMDANMARFSDTFQALAEKNDQYGLCGCYQNHAGTRLGGSLWDLKEALAGIDPDLVSCQFDIRHAVFEGMRSWENDFRAIEPHIRTTVLKDFKWTGDQGGSVNVPLGEGVVDFSKYMTHYKRLESDSPISLHAEYPLFTETEKKASKTEKMDIAIQKLGEDLAFARKHIHA